MDFLGYRDYPKRRKLRKTKKAKRRKTRKPRLFLRVESLERYMDILREQVSRIMLENTRTERARNSKRLKGRN